MQLRVHVLENGAGLILEVVDLQDLLLEIDRNAQVGSNEIEQKIVVVDVFQHHDGLGRNLRRELYDLACSIPHAADHGAEFEFIFRRIVFEGTDLTDHVWVVVHQVVEVETLSALQNGCCGAIWHFEEFENTRHRTHLIQVAGRG